MDVSALRRAHEQGTYGEKKLSEWLALLLRHMMVYAVRSWVEWSGAIGDEYKARATREIDAYDKVAKRKKGPQPTAQAAWYAAQRFDELLPKIKFLRQRLKKLRPRPSKLLLLSAIEEVVPWHKLREAVQPILEERDISPHQVIFSDLSNSEIVSEVVRSELQEKICSVDMFPSRKTDAWERSLSSRYRKSLPQLIAAVRESDS